MRGSGDTPPKVGKQYLGSGPRGAPGGMEDRLGRPNRRKCAGAGTDHDALLTVDMLKSGTRTGGIDVRVK